MSLIFRLNAIVLILFVAVFLSVLLKVLHSTAHNIEQEANTSFELTNQMVDAQIKLIRSYPFVEVRPERKLSLFKLEQFDYIKYIDVELFDTNNEIIGTNKPYLLSTKPEVQDYLKPFLMIGFDVQNEAKSRIIDIGPMHLGRIVVHPDIDAQLRVLRDELQETLTPILILFLLTLIGIMLAISYIVMPVYDFVRAVNQQRTSSILANSSLSLFNQMIRLPSHLQGIRHELRDSTLKVDELNNKILHLQEEERRRLSAELHDELGQHLTAIRFEAEVIRTAKSLEDTEQSAEAIDEIGRRMRDIVRSIIERLRPPELDLFGLEGALKEMVAGWQVRHADAIVDFQCTTSFTHLDDTKQLSIYRIVQEALTNISRHSGSISPNIVVSLTQVDHQITISISDDGNGCDLSKEPNGFGLKGMRERVDGLSGVMTLISSLGNGMKIIVEFPTK